MQLNDEDVEKKFPLSLATACPVKYLRNYMACSFRHMAVLRAIGRNGDFSRYPSIDRAHKSHRDSKRTGADIDAVLAGRKRLSHGGGRTVVTHSER